MSEQRPEDFAADSPTDSSPDEHTQMSRRSRRAAEADDSTQLSARRRPVPDAHADPVPNELDDSTQLAQRRRAPAEAEPPQDFTQLSAKRAKPLVEADLDEETRMALRHAREPDVAQAADEPEDDGTKIATRRALREAAAASEPSSDSVAPQTRPGAAEASVPLGSRRGPTLETLPPGIAPAGMRAHEGGFGTQIPAYRPRAALDGVPVTSPPSSTGTAPGFRPEVLNPVEAQHKRDATHRASLAKAVIVGVGVLVVGTAAVIGILLLVRGLL
jgi:hypothetical protein